MFYLYLKTHNVTGLNYLGQTTQNPLVYQGSGKYWKSHIKKHGYDVTTVVIYETPFIEEIKEQGLYFSDLWNIVDSNEFANMIVESGEGGIPSNETKRKISEANKGKTRTEETKRKISEAKKDKTLSDYHKRRMSEVRKGKIFSDETKRKISEAKKGRPSHRKGKSHSEESKIQMSESHKGKTLSEEHKRKTSETMTGLQRPKIACPHCGKIGALNVMTRWHFDNCKFRM